ncbi:MAG: thioredoxin family protein [Ignavibacteriaceae bacterium]
MAHQFFIDRKPHRGMTYREYMQSIIDEISNTNPETLNDDQKEIFEYKKLNLQRSGRVDKTYVVSENLKNTIKNIKEKQFWMVLTEGWCGDSAQNLPHIAKIAEVNPNIELRILLRDSNLDIIDLYLTNGTRSIPKLAAFDEEGNELFIWGPRPKQAQELLIKLKSEGIVKPELYEKLHLWYGRNRGKEIEEEFLEIFSQVEQQ